MAFSTPSPLQTRAGCRERLIQTLAVSYSVSASSAGPSFAAERPLAPRAAARATPRSSDACRFIAKRTGLWHLVGRPVFEGRVYEGLHGRWRAAGAAASASAASEESGASAGASGGDAIPDSLRRLGDIGALRCVRLPAEGDAGPVDVYVLGTNHVDPNCSTDVREAIRELEPDAVLLELCGWRVPVLLQASADPVAERDRVQHRVGLGDVYGMFFRDGIKGLLRGYMAVQLSVGAKKFGAQTGNEFVAAADEAAARGVPVILADRSCIVTDERMADVAQRAVGPVLVLLCAATGIAWAVSRFSPPVVAGSLVLFAALPSLAFFVPWATVSAQATEEALADMYRRALAGERLPGLMNALFYDVLVTERDAVMAAAARAHPRLPPARRRLLAVVGAAHAPGLARALAGPPMAEGELAGILALPAGQPRALRERAAAAAQRADAEAYGLLGGLYRRHGRRAK